MIEGAIFDLDGTLLDTMGMWSEVINIYLRSIGKEPKPDLMETIWNMSLEQCGDFLKADYGLTLSTEEIVSGVLAQVADYYRYEAKPMPHVKELLKSLQERGVRMIVATASEHIIVSEALAHCEMLDFFQDVIDCSQVGHGKDEPVIYDIAMEKLGTVKENTLVFEDATYAIETLKNNGFYAVAIHSIYEKNTAKIQALSDAYIESYDNLDSFWKFADSL